MTSTRSFSRFRASLAFAATLAVPAICPAREIAPESHASGPRFSPAKSAHAEAHWASPPTANVASFAGIGIGALVPSGGAGPAP